jgi:FMN phosphatase YigB (HAD superfamily)
MIPDEVVRPDARHRDPQSHDHDLLTVDVWDTLLRRRCHPDAVKLHVARYLMLTYWHDLPTESRDVWVLLRLRQQAEKDIGDQSRAQGLDDEYGHMQVYRRWLELAGMTLPNADGSHDDLLATLDGMELAQEKHVSYVDPTIAETLGRHNARRALFLSDFYMPASAIDALLTHHGIGHLVEDGVVSCDVGLNKRSGRLFAYLHERFGIHPSRHAHVGDNPHADVEAAQRMGIQALHYLPAGEHGLRRQREAAFHDRSAALRRAATDSLVATALPGHSHQEVYDYGRKCAPLLIGFVMHVLERALAERVEHLYFFTREGEFFLEIYRRLVAQDVLGFPAPPADLLCVSRLATFAGSLREFSTGELMRLWNQYSVQSLQALFISLAMQPELFAPAAARHGLDLIQPVRYPWLDPKVIGFLGDSEVLALIEGELAEKRDLLHAYLNSAGITGARARVGIVDIGWRGTIQDNLAYARQDVLWHGCYLALNRFLNTQPDNSRKSAFGPDLNRSDADKSLLDFVAPIEMLCNSPNGSVVGYRSGATGVQVMRHVDSEENRVHEAYVHAFQQGVLAVVPYWADTLRCHAYASEDLKPLALAVWRDIIEHPPAFLAKAYYQLNHNETFGVGGFSDKGSLPSTTDILLAFMSRTRRHRLHLFLMGHGWIPGLLACPDVDPGFRRLLGWFLRGVELRRRLRGLFAR